MDDISQKSRTAHAYCRYPTITVIYKGVPYQGQEKNALNNIYMIYSTVWTTDSCYRPTETLAREKSDGSISSGPVNKIPEYNYKKKKKVSQNSGISIRSMNEKE